ncbi:MAG: GatB/YqeY domain-containing protein [Anaerovoracaceae bacterium]|nr:GatB/YqeY domain-containing protein [Bacillota bacterium]MDY2671416.1 GatB/YqeY domain-containing protein [Anaerovoracaceae bacterium]
MSLKDRLSADFKEALKAHDKVRRDTISFARAAIKQYEIDNSTELDDEGIIGILSKQVKIRKDALSDFEKAGRNDLIESYTNEIKVLQEYLPKPFSEEELRKIILDTKEELGIGEGKAGMGKLMGAVMPKVKGRADGGDVKKIVMSVL